MTCRCSPWVDGRGEARKVCGGEFNVGRTQPTFWGSIRGERSWWEAMLTVRGQGNVVLSREQRGPFLTKAAAKRSVEEWMRPLCAKTHGPGFAGRRR